MDNYLRRDKALVADAQARKLFTPFKPTPNYVRAVDTVNFQDMDTLPPKDLFPVKNDKRAGASSLPWFLR